jgi:hypothetical protein
MCALWSGVKGSDDALALVWPGELVDALSDHDNNSGHTGIALSACEKETARHQAGSIKEDRTRLFDMDTLASIYSKLRRKQPMGEALMIRVIIRRIAPR